MTQFWTVARGAWFMVSCILVSLFWTFISGIYLDKVMPAFVDAGLDAGAGTAWDTTGVVTAFVNLDYFIPLLLSGIGIVVFFLSITRKHRYESEEQEYYYR